MSGRPSVVLWVQQDRRRLLNKCPDHVRQLLRWVGNNPRLLVAALSILSQAWKLASPGDILLGERLNPTCDGVDDPLFRINCLNRMVWQWGRIIGQGGATYQPAQHRTTSHGEC